jgi:hypothetical protein
MAHASTSTAEVWAAGDPRVPRLVVAWLGACGWSWSAPPPAGRRTAIVSSRLPRLLDPRGTWLKGLRAALGNVHDMGEVVVCGHGAAGCELVLRGAVRQNSPAIVLQCDERHGRARTASSTSTTVGVPNPCVPEAGSPPTAEIASIAARDRAAIAWADRVIVLRLRTGGNLHRLLRARMQSSDADISLVDLPGLQSRQSRDELTAMGARLWVPVGNSDPKRQSSVSAAGPETRPLGWALTDSITGAPGLRAAPATPPQLISCPIASGWDFLTHTTRACPGPWPNQSRDDYFDSLLDARPDGDHSALAALRRIVAERRLVASSHTIRSGFRVVSFSAVPLAELPQLRVFRSHRGRWDFEPYGLCIRHRWLEARGAQAVIYTGDSDWSRLGDADRPFFQYVRQLDSTAPPPDPHRPPIDWSLEREWRHVGDLDLNDLPRNDGMLFVPTRAEAEILLETSPWPVTFVV